MTDDDCNKILPNLYLGNIVSAEPSNLKKLNIKHVINISNSTYEKLPSVMYMDIMINDLSNVNITEHFDKTNKIIKNATLKGENVLVHCQMGISRSASIVLAYLLSRNLSLKISYLFVKNKRPIIGPNFGFYCQLANYERYMTGKLTLQPWTYLGYTEAEYNRSPYKAKYNVTVNNPINNKLAMCKALLD
jgi:protein-tyrosine phosphatase